MFFKRFGRNRWIGYALAVVLAVFIGAVGSSVAEGSSYYGQVVRVIDGDTLDIEFAGKKQRVRLSDIDAPELSQDYGTEAAAVLENIVGNGRVIVIPKEYDRYGRCIATLVNEGKDRDLSVNEIMVATGAAWWYRRYSNNFRFQRLESEARSARRGLWEGKRPMEPWNYRRR